jgi:hypothetical protein
VYLKVEVCNVALVQETEAFKYLSHDLGCMLLLKPFLGIQDPLQFTSRSSASQHELIKKSNLARCYEYVK